MRTTILAILGLIVGFFVGEAMAAFVGIATHQISGGMPSGVVLWILRPLPFIGAVAGAIALPALIGQRGPG